MKELMPEVLRARLRLMLEFPFLAAAVARFPILEVPSAVVATMATDGYHIFYCVDFVRTMTPDETIGVLAHEVLHCLFGHIERRRSRDPGIWNEAIDYATNQCLLETGFTLPSSRLQDYKFRRLTAEDIYDLLVKDPQRKQGWDIHLESGDALSLNNRDQDAPSPDDLRKLRIELAARVRSELQGRQAGLWSEELSKGSEPRFDWKSYLAQFVQGLSRSDFRFFPANKKHLWQGLYLPSLGVPGPKRIVAAIDTSGSMSVELLGEALA